MFFSLKKGSNQQNLEGLSHEQAHRDGSEKVLFPDRDTKLARVLGVEFHGHGLCDQTEQREREQKYNPRSFCADATFEIEERCDHRNQRKDAQDHRQCRNVHWRLVELAHRDQAKHRNARDLEDERNTRRRDEEFRTADLGFLAEEQQPCGDQPDD